MAKTFNDIVYSLLEIATNFGVTDDVEYPIKWIEDELISVHNTLMRDAYRNKILGPELLQIHENTEVKPMTKDISINGVSITVKMDLCYADIPELISGIPHKIVDYVGTSELNKAYSYRKIRDLVDGSGVVWKLPTPAYSILGNKILLSKKDVAIGRLISIIAFFRDPRDVNTYDPTEEFQTPSEFKLETLALKHILSTKGVPPDIINDAQRALGSPQQQEKVKDE